MSTKRQIEDGQGPEPPSPKRCQVHLLAPDDTLRVDLRPVKPFIGKTPAAMADGRASSALFAVNSWAKLELECRENVKLFLLLLLLLFCFGYVSEIEMLACRMCIAKPLQVQDTSPWW